MYPAKVFVAHSWIDVSVNIQTKQVAFELSKKAQVWFFTQARINQPLPSNKNLQVVEWPNKRPTKLKDFIFAIRYVKAVKPDIIIVHYAATKAMLFAGWLLGIKYRIAWYHTLSTGAKMEAGSKWKGLFDVWVRTVFYKLATHIVAFTRYAANDAIEQQYVNAKKICIIPNSINPSIERRASYNYIKQKKSFLFLGRLMPIKGCDQLIPVFKKLATRYTNISLEIVGAGEDAAKLQQLINAYKLQDIITLHGSTKNYKEVFSYLNEAYCLLVPSRVDNFPTVILEAKACGLPAIGAKVCGIPEMIEDGVNGFICTDEEEWVKKCSIIIENTGLRNSMAVQARVSYEEKYAIDKHVNRVMQLIDSLP